MTSWQEQPLRPHGQAWPGLNTKGGRLDNGSGQMEDGSINAWINEDDLLEKRSGFVRGLDERFAGPVCGLFRYTDDCGIERILVADEQAISIRSPFVVPVFTVSDAYPFDSFSEDGDVDENNWRNTGDYTQLNDALFIAAGVAEFSGTNLPVSRLMRWFKTASNLSYQVRVQYQFDSAAVEQRSAIVIKGNGDLSSGAYLKADLVFDGTNIRVDLFHHNGDVQSQIATSPVTGLLPPSGFFSLKYQRNVAAGTYIPSVEIVPTGGSILTLAADSLTAIADADLGQISAIGLGYKTTSPADLQTLVVDGGPL